MPYVLRVGKQICQGEYNNFGIQILQKVIIQQRLGLGYALPHGGYCQHAYHFFCLFVFFFFLLFYPDNNKLSPWIFTLLTKGLKNEMHFFCLFPGMDWPSGILGISLMTNMLFRMTVLLLKECIYWSEWPVKPVYHPD